MVSKNDKIYHICSLQLKRNFSKIWSTVYTSCYSNPHFLRVNDTTRCGKSFQCRNETSFFKLSNFFAFLLSLSFSLSLSLISLVPGWHIPSFFFHHFSKAVTKFELLLGLFTLIKEIWERACLHWRKCFRTEHFSFQFYLEKENTRIS